jgi:hypothetical protein
MQLGWLVASLILVLIGVWGGRNQLKKLDSSGQEKIVKYKI